MATHSRNNVVIVAAVAVVIVVLAYVFVFYPQEMPNDAILPAITATEPVENSHEPSLQSTEEGLFLQSSDGERVKIQVQGAPVGSFAPTHSRPSQ